MTDRYKNGKIYKLVSDKTDDIYIGSCCVPLHKRLYQHKSSYKFWKLNNTKKVCSSSIFFDTDGSIEIILLEEFPTDTKIKLLARERWHIENTNCVNIRRPITSINEKKEEGNTYSRKFFKELKEFYPKEQQLNETILEGREKYRHDNKEAISKTCRIWYEKNKDEYLKKTAENYQKKKGYVCEKIDCNLCDKKISRGNMKRHMAVHKKNFKE